MYGLSFSHGKRVSYLRKIHYYKVWSLAIESLNLIHPFVHHDHSIVPLILKKETRSPKYCAPEYNEQPMLMGKPGWWSLYFDWNHNTQNWGYCVSNSPASVPEAEEKSKISQPTRCQGSRIGFPIDPKNTKAVKDVEILLNVKLRSNPLSCCRDVENVSANQKAGFPSWFSYRQI